MSRKKTKKAMKRSKGGRTPKIPKASKSDRPAGNRKAATPAGATDKPMSGLDGAAKVLADAGEPMRARELVDAMIGGGLWKSGGKTPHSTIYAAMIREIAAKGDAARFKKVDRGLFAFNG